MIKDAPFTRVDLVSCRNLLIYLQPAAQQKVLSLFHFALNRGGVLFLGPSESPGPLARDFESVDKHWRLYRKHSDVRMPVDTRRAAAARAADVRLATATAPSPRRPLLALAAARHLRRAARRVMPPSLLSTSAASWSTRSAARAASCACATAGRASTCSTWSTPS